jgi:predicted enzyme related to lactoylglutathione lyase
MPDPLEALRLPEAPLMARPMFAAELRRRITAAVRQRPTEEQAMPSDVRIHRVETYLSVSDPRAAIAFYEEAFGARLMGEPIVMADGRIGHCELGIGDSIVRVAGEHPQEAVRDPASLGGTTVQLYVSVDDADAVVEKARAAGAEVLRPVEEVHGSRTGKVRDPFGHNWFVVAEVASPHVTAGLGYFTLRAPDGPRAREFWSSLFDWELLQGPEGYHIANIEPPGGIETGAPVPAVSVFFRVADIDLAAERVRALGGSVGEIVRRGSGANAECADDQGVPFQLWSPAPGY